MTTTTPPERFDDLAERIRDDLRRQCRSLSTEQLTVYAVQIALAELNAVTRRRTDALELYTLGVTLNATN